MSIRNCVAANFALASVVDAEGASDVFPTVIMEAMACARPVVSTTLAGIPESVIDGVLGCWFPRETGKSLRSALDKLVRDPALRARIGEAGRSAMETEFNVMKTIEPLHELFAAWLSAVPAKRPAAAVAPEGKQTAYLIDRWPEENLPFLEMELRALRRNQVPHLAFVLHPPLDFDPAAKTNDLVMISNICPMRWWSRQSGKRARHWFVNWRRCGRIRKHRPAIRLVFGAGALGSHLAEIVLPHNIGHVHATSSRTLLCALFLKRLLGLSVSAAIESVRFSRNRSFEKRWINASAGEAITANCWPAGGRYSF